jgi:hypothetical protein
MWWTLLSTIMVDTTTKLETRTRPTSHIRSVLLINFLSHFCGSFTCSTVTVHRQVSDRLRGLSAGMRETTASTKAYCQFWRTRAPSPNLSFFMSSQNCLWNFRESGIGDRPNKRIHEDSSLLRPDCVHGFAVSDISKGFCGFIFRVKRSDSKTTLEAKDKQSKSKPIIRRNESLTEKATWLTVADRTWGLPTVIVGEIPKRDNLFFIIKPTRCTNFTNLFRHETLHVSDSSSVHHQEFIHCTLNNGICHTGL